MTTEQLQAARAERWRQKANPVLTLQDATEWIESTGICFFLPRRMQFPAPGPSFVEAVSGESNPTPSPASIQDAFSLAVRLFAAGGAVPLNLLGAVSEQPDFLASPEALPYVFSLRGDRNWKRGPGKGSQLTADLWQLLKREGALTAAEVQEKLGRGVSEAAVHRSLTELWGGLYVVPIYSEGEATVWALFESQHQKAMHTGGGMAQATALSALISLYLDSVIAATAEDIETFLSPLAPRSRIREVARGLLAMRQLSALSLGPQSLLFITGGLPEFSAVEVSAEAPAEQPVPPAVPVAEERPQQPRQPRKPFAPRPPRRGPREGHPRREGERGGSRPPRRAPQSGERRQGEQGLRASHRPEWKRNEGRPERGGGESRPFRKEGGFERKKPFAREERPFQKRRPFAKQDNRQERPERREFSQDARREKRFEGSHSNKPFSKSRSGPKPKSGPKEFGPKFGAKAGGKFSPKFGTPKSGRKFPSRPGNKPPFKKREKRKDQSGE